MTALEPPDVYDPSSRRCSRPSHEPDANGPEPSRDDDPGPPRAPRRSHVARGRRRIPQTGSVAMSPSMTSRSAGSAIVGERGDRLGLPVGRRARVSGHGGGSGHRLIGGGQVPVLGAGDPGRRRDSAWRATARARRGRGRRRRASTATRRAQVDGQCALGQAPVVARGVGGVDHLVDLGRRCGPAARAGSRRG